MRSTLTKLRTFYLLTGLAGGVFVPYLSVLLQHDGLTSSEIGIAMATGTFVAILAQPFWGFFVDRFQFTRIALAISCLLPGLLAILFDAKMLWLIVIASAVSSLFSTPQAPISDAYAVNSARLFGTSYGTIRCFGSLGFASGAYFGGFYLAHLPVSWLFIPFLGLSVGGMFVAFAFPRQSIDVGVGRSITHGLQELIRDRTFLAMLTGGFLVSQTLTAFNTYFALAFRAMGGSMAMTGTAFLLASATNIPAMVIASRVIGRISHERTMMLAALAYVLRWGLQTAFPIPWVGIAVQILHGTSFGFFYVAAVDYVSRKARKELQATGQSVFGMVTGGLAGIVGNLMNGILLRVGGPVLMYGVCALSAAAGTACFWYVYSATRRYSPSAMVASNSHSQ